MEKSDNKKSKQVPKQKPKKEDKLDKYINQGIHTLITVGLIIIGLLLINRYMEIKSKKTNQVELAEGHTIPEDCVVSSEAGIMDKPYLRGVLEEKEHYQLVKIYEGCEEFQTGQIVSFRVSTRSAPEVRIIRAQPGQKIELERSKSQRAWSLLVDGDVVKDHSGQPYWFGVYPNKPQIGYYIDRNGNRLQDGDYLIFSTVSPGVNDSGQFGVIAAENIIGRVLRQN